MTSDAKRYPCLSAHPNRYPKREALWVGVGTDIRTFRLSISMNEAYLQCNPSARILKLGIMPALSGDHSWG
jgi:hypothetical protein